MTDQGVHLAGADVEVDIGQGLGPRKRLREALNAKDDPARAVGCRTGLGVARPWIVSTVLGHAPASPFSGDPEPPSATRASHMSGERNTLRPHNSYG